MPKNWLSFARNFLTRFLQPLTHASLILQRGAQTLNIHFLVLTNVGRFLYFTGNQRFSGFAIFNIKENRLVWVYSIFSKNKTRQFQGRLEFSENKTNQFKGRLDGFLILITTCISGLVGAQFQLLSRNNCGTDFKVKM